MKKRRACGSSRSHHSVRMRMYEGACDDLLRAHVPTQVRHGIVLVSEVTVPPTPTLQNIKRRARTEPCPWPMSSWKRVYYPLRARTPSCHGNMYVFPDVQERGEDSPGGKSSESEFAS